MRAHSTTGSVAGVASYNVGLAAHSSAPEITAARHGGEDPLCADAVDDAVREGPYGHRPRRLLQESYLEIVADANLAAEISAHEPVNFRGGGVGLAVRFRLAGTSVRA
jgi:hypothetical protein